MPPLPISAYLLETRHLRAREHGAYLLLLIEYWLQGPLCDDDAKLASVVKLDHKSWREIRSSIRRLFTIGKDGRLHHERSDLERIKADKITTMLWIPMKPPGYTEVMPPIVPI